jgi:hypothetical protein
MPAGYSKRSLIDKLGIKPNSDISIVHAPVGYDVTLGPLPAGVRTQSMPKGDIDFIQAFYTESKVLAREFPKLKKALKPNGMLWISWPKKAAKMITNLTEDHVRNSGLQHGLVDIKVCAVDDVWSGLKFVYRLTDRARDSQ